MITRRDFLKTSIAASTLASVPSFAKSATKRFDVGERFRALEKGHARLGVCLLDTVTGEVSGNRMEERFAMCSTFKFAMVAACLHEADNGRLNLNQVLPYSETDLLPWAPVTKKYLNTDGLSIEVLAKAAQQLSDGTAANLLVKRLGGPSAVTTKFREMGDTVSRLDHYEPDMAFVLSADTRNTPTPLAYANLVKRILTGNILQETSRQRLVEWTQSTKTGARRLRAGLPSEWHTGNKTGTGRDAGTTNKCNDIAITFPPGKNPVVIAAYFDSGEYTEQIEKRHEAVLAEVGKIAAEWAMS